jgi:hypothetical protein
VQVLIRGSVVLNLCLVLYLSLSAGWNLSSSTQHLNAPYARDIQFFGKRLFIVYWRSHPDPAFDVNAGPNPAFALMRIRIQLFT